MDKTIRVRNETYQRLARHGDLSSSFDRTLNRILDTIEGQISP